MEQGTDLGHLAVFDTLGKNTQGLCAVCACPATVTAPKPAQLGKGMEVLWKQICSLFRGAACGSLDVFSDALLIFPKER